MPATCCPFHAFSDLLVMYTNPPPQNSCRCTRRCGGCRRPLACWRMWRADHRSDESSWSAGRRRCWPTGPFRRLRAQIREVAPEVGADRDRGGSAGRGQAGRDHQPVAVRRPPGGRDHRSGLAAGRAATRRHRAGRDRRWPISPWSWCTAAGPKGKGLLDKLKAAGVEVVDCPPVKAWELPQFVSAEAKQLGTTDRARRGPGAGRRRRDTTCAHWPARFGSWRPTARAGR